MSALDAIESVALMMVSQYARVTLYPTDTPTVRPEVLISRWDDGESFVLLNTNLPDGIVYTVVQKDMTVEPVLTAYKKVDDTNPTW